jgi:hypothetical protein
MYGVGVACAARGASNAMTAISAALVDAIRLQEPRKRYFIGMFPPAKGDWLEM